MTSWELTRHPGELALVQLPPHAAVPRWAYDEEREAALWSVARTADELSVICSFNAVPGSVSASGPYLAFSVDGPLDHSLVGVLAGLLEPLAADQIPVMAQSTFDTDWILVPTVQADSAAQSWTRAGHAVTVVEEDR
jgi:uncharacterized protein